MFRREPQAEVPVSAAHIPPDRPVTGERSDRYWLLVPRQPQRPMPIPREPFLVRIGPGDPQWGQFAIREYHRSGQGTPPTGITHVNRDDAAFLSRHYPEYDVTAPTLLPGQYHPRIWRNGWTAAQDCPHGYRAYPAELCVARRAAAVSVNRLLQQLSLVFETVEPASANADVFGPALRHLLIVACTEVEASWRGILSANGYPQTARLTTNDYVKLFAPMRLDEYAFRLALYHDEWTQVVAPFATWNPNQATQSLTWYDAYNATKHDREGSRARANLRAVIDAVAAAVTLLAAQFGEDAPEVRAALNHMSGFELVAEPSWHATELYFPADNHAFEPTPLWRDESTP